MFGPDEPQTRVRQAHAFGLQKVAEGRLSGGTGTGNPYKSMVGTRGVERCCASSSGASDELGSRVGRHLGLLTSGARSRTDTEWKRAWKVAAAGMAEPLDRTRDFEALGIEIRDRGPFARRAVCCATSSSSSIW